MLSWLPSCGEVLLLRARARASATWRWPTCSRARCPECARALPERRAGLPLRLPVSRSQSAASCPRPAASRFARTSRSRWRLLVGCAVMTGSAPRCSALRSSPPPWSTGPEGSGSPPSSAASWRARARSSPPTLWPSSARRLALGATHAVDPRTEDVAALARELPTDGRRTPRSTRPARRASSLRPMPCAPRRPGRRRRPPAGGRDGRSARIRPAAGGESRHRQLLRLVPPAPGHAARPRPVHGRQARPRRARHADLHSGRGQRGLRRHERRRGGTRSDPPELRRADADRRRVCGSGPNASAPEHRARPQGRAGGDRLGDRAGDASAGARPSSSSSGPTTR